jgi:hypothetical protein
MKRPYERPTITPMPAPDMREPADWDRAPEPSVADIAASMRRVVAGLLVVISCYAFWLAAIWWRGRKLHERIPQCR